MNSVPNPIFNFLLVETCLYDKYFKGIEVVVLIFYVFKFSTYSRTYERDL